MDSKSFTKEAQMKCSVSGCQQEVMPRINKFKKSIPHLYPGVCNPDKATPHWGFPTYQEDMPICYYHKKKDEGKFEGMIR